MHDIFEVLEVKLLPWKVRQLVYVKGHGFSVIQFASYMVWESAMSNKAVYTNLQFFKEHKSTLPYLRGASN